MFARVLIANRGEIAVRIIRACRELGIESVAVYSDADAGAMHVRLADRAERIGPAAAHESYLSAGALIDAARRAGAQAVHPGYGFLAENAAFAAACRDASLVFIGPPPEAIERLGSKTEARRLVAAHGVPVVPGEVPQDQSDEAIAAAAARVGFPALIKPSAGGGGIGMRGVFDATALVENVRAARRDALAAFGDATLYVEHLVDRPRHVEIQIIGDARGQIVHLGERECSLQRRHQKVIEESPSVAVNDALRAEMGTAAIAAARAAGYQNAGTVEFLLEETSQGPRFYFLEMNTRLQVEHPVTEAVYGVDLVHAQLRVAAGESLDWTSNRTPRGHAIEARIYAEDPAQSFLPQAGPLRLYREPRGPGIRVDSGFEEGDSVAVHYDPLVAKLIVQAEDRTRAILRLRTALARFPILGVRTNVPYLLAVVEDPAFARAKIDTTWLDRETARIVASLGAEQPSTAAIAAAAQALERRPREATQAESHRADPWTTLSGWRLGS
jgi:acetyl/propionyl-CoA carboxylase alpha subunit